MTYGIFDFEYDQDLFNNAAGTSCKVDETELTNQLNLIIEETSEIAEALHKKDAVGVLDGSIDTLFVVLGLIQKLKVSGYLTYEAMQRVATNNLSKFPTNYNVVLKTMEYYNQQGIECHYEHLKEYGCYVIRDSNNKVRKPIGYTPVDLSDCVPGGVI